MFFITFSNLWSFSFFFFLTYTTLIISLITYMLPVLSSPLKYTTSKNKSEFVMINATDLMYVFATPLVCIIFSLMLWTAPSTSAWFGHIVITSFQTKLTYLVLLNFLLIIAVTCSTTYFTSREIYDYTITTFNFLYWIVIIFYSNTIFTSIFVIEVLSTLIFLLLITSTFSSTFFYRNLNLSFGHLFQQSTPYSYLQSILYFFWVSLGFRQCMQRAVRCTRRWPDEEHKLFFVEFLPRSVPHLFLVKVPNTAVDISSREV